MSGRDPAPSRDDWSPPTEFEEYRLLRAIGEGEFGRVYLAEDLLLCRPVAVKFLSREADPALREQFFVEARAVARLNHPNVVAIYRYGEIKRRPYLVSEYVRGEPLDKLTKALTPAELLAVAVGLCRGLAAAHRRGVLHRDLKPANALYTDEGEVKLLDFGMAKLLDRPRALGAKEPLVGSPLYIAPELWQGEPATPRSDLYALGVLLFELCTGRPTYPCQTVGELEAARAAGDPPSVASLAPHIDARLSGAIDRCLQRDPERRFPSGDALRDALEERPASDPHAESPTGNPYRGLSAFSAEHRTVFFGREAEVGVILDRLRVEPLVVVVGDSGVGTSSLCSAGVLPLAEARCGWKTLSMVPGKHPLGALCRMLAPSLGVQASDLLERVRQSPLALADAIRRANAGELALFVDQMEELLTLSEADEARLVGEALAALAGRVPNVRLLGTVRSDFLSRLATLPGLGDELGRAVHLVRPLSLEGMREAIVGPARHHGVQFESEELVQMLLDSAQGGLPFLQFALAELWETRDRDARMIRAAGLEAIGGVPRALAGHADRVLEALLPAEREAARRVLLSMVTVDGTRARVSGRQLLGDRDAAGRAALEALVRGRLLVAHKGEPGEAGAFEIAHEALLKGWDTLRGWLSGDIEQKLVRERLSRAAQEWARLDSARELLYKERQLHEVAALDLAQLGPRESAFLAASRRAERWRKLRRWSVPAAVLLLIAEAIGGARWYSQRALRQSIAARTVEAEQLMDRARDQVGRASQERDRAFALFDGQDWPGGEKTWTEVLELDRQVDALYANAASLLEAALSLDPNRSTVRNRLADVLYERVLWADRTGRRDLEGELRARLPSYDLDGERRRRLEAPAHVTLKLTPSPTMATVQRYEMGSRHLTLSAPMTVSGEVELPPGSYLFSFRAVGHHPVNLPVMVKPNEPLALVVSLPKANAVPDGFVYVPAGRFLFGCGGAEEIRRDANAAPMHEISTPAYLIARHEVTFAEWIEFLDAQSPEERRRRTPLAQRRQQSIELRQSADGKWDLSLRPTSHTYTARLGEPIRYLDRERRAVQSWASFPVAGVSYEDALSYAAWLDQTGRVPGARPCDEYEWERAARGADGRIYPMGDAIGADDANYDVTYDRQPLAFGPDEVGAHPASRSPFGVDDLAGNVWEWVSSVARPGEVVFRGGSWYQGRRTSRSDNREIGERTFRHPFHGVRICANP